MNHSIYIYQNDISGLENINEIYECSLVKKWIKLISNDKQLLFDKYNRKDNFIKVADIVLDNELFTSGKKQGTKKRNTLIQFIPQISNEEFSKSVLVHHYLFYMCFYQDSIFHHNMFLFH